MGSNSMTAATRARVRVRLSPDELRAALLEIGLREEVKATEGYGFTFYKDPAAAVAFWQEQHGGAEATRFYLHPRMFVLAE